jgi:hypothetical protein
LAITGLAFVLIFNVCRIGIKVSFFVCGWQFMMELENKTCELGWKGFDFGETFWQLCQFLGILTPSRTLREKRRRKRYD